MRIKYDSDILKIMSLFETITRAKLKDCIVTDRILFVVEPNEIGKAIGKKGSNIRRLEDMFNKKIRVVEYNESVIQFITNMIAPLRANKIEEENNIIKISGPDTKTKGLIIGREAKNLHFLKDIAGRYFDFEDIKVI